MAIQELPAGQVTVLFTDIEGSTRLIEELGESGYIEALAEHRRLLRTAFRTHGGVEVDTQGDAFFYAFADPTKALAAAAQGQNALAAGPIKVRMGLHTGLLQLTGEGYAGRELHRAARIAASGHGGQVVVSATTQALVEGKLMELGEHRLKDFDEPIALFQLSSGNFPPLKTISNTNLPRAVSSFVGRERELVEVLAKVEGGARLLTLTGPGGSGKTRLAIEAATSLVPSFKAGVFWVGLASLRESSLVAEAVTQTLGAKDGLAEYIGQREMLLLLDNLEQVITAASALSALLTACPNLTLLCTSRELLRVQGEVEYQVPPLASSEAVALFCERSGLEASAEIKELCERLDDLPLGVELAAARTRALSPAQILDRLADRLDLLRGGRDADARQQTLRATIAWSYELLSVEEQRVFAELSVFAGGCRLEAAVDVTGADLDSLQSLVEKSLLRFSRERYSILETIREFAADQLQVMDNGTSQRRRHLGWYLAFAEEMERGSRAGARETLFDHLEEEHDNLRAAFAYARDLDEPDLEARLAAALWRFWADRGYVAEGSRRLDEALQRSEIPPLAARLGRCYFQFMTSWVYDEIVNEARAIAATADSDSDRFTRVQALSLIGSMTIAASSKQAAEALQEAIALSSGVYPAEEAEAIGWLLVTALYGPLTADEAIALCRRFDHPAANRKVLAFARVERAALEAMRGEFDTARRLLEEGRDIFRELNLNVFGANTAQEGYFVAMLAGNPHVAVEELSAAHDLLAEMGERGFLSTIAGYLAHACFACSDLRAADHWAKVCADAASEDDLLSQALWRAIRGRLLARAGAHEAALAHAQEAVTIYRQTDGINTTADRLTDLADVHLVAGHSEAASHALDEALTLYEQKGNLVAAERTRSSRARVNVETSQGPAVDGLDGKRRA